MITERTFFNDADSFVTVRHLTIHGTNFQIGQRLGQLALERYGKTPDQFRADPLFARARHAFLQRNYPIQWERVRGVASALGLDPNDGRYDLTGITYHMDIPMPAPGCSAVYYPPSTTTSGGGYLSRNYDFPIGSIADLMHVPLPPAVKDKLPPVMSEPYIMAWYPEDAGYASLAIHAFDLISGTLDGMNSAGLVVSILADEEAQRALGPNIEMHPGMQQVVGLHELQVMRFLLDTCATAEEARTALLTIKQYYRFTPNHYIVADRSGHSFIYENSTGRNVQHVIEGKGQPQVITNHQHYKHCAGGQASVGALTFENNSFWRYQTLQDRIAEHQGLFTAADVKANNACVNLHDAVVAAGVQARTVWHCLYDQKAGTVEFSFYLGEDVRADGTFAERRSDYLKFEIDSVMAAQQSQGG